MSGAPRAATQRIAGRAKLCGCSVATYTTATRGYVGIGPRYDEGSCKAWSGHAHRNMRWRRRTPSKIDHMKRKFKIPARATPSSLRSSSEGVRSEVRKHAALRDRYIAKVFREFLVPPHRKLYVPRSDARALVVARGVPGEFHGLCDEVLKHCG